MRWAALALTVCGCNQIFDLKATNIVDASPDVAIDAPRTCPAIGTPLKFGTEFRQVVRQDCQGYNFSSAANIGVASCTETMPTYINAPYQGTLGQPMTKVDVGLAYVDTVRIYPEGDRVFARGYDMATNMYKLASYSLGLDGSWTETKETIAPNVTGATLSTFTSAPDRRVIIGSYNAAPIEYAQDESGAWSMVMTHPIAEWKCQYVTAMSLTTDGLRLFVTCNRNDTYRVETRYAERGSRSDMFGPLNNIENAPANLGLVVVSDDCSRAYFSALNAVFSADLEY